MADDEQERRERLHAWVQKVADRDHGGVWMDAAIDMLDALRLAEQDPSNPWAYLEARQRQRVKR